MALRSTKRTKGDHHSPDLRVTDDRRFDVDMVHSMLTYLNDCSSFRDAAAAIAPFAWTTEVLSRRARLGGIPLSSVHQKLEAPKDLDRCREIAGILEHAMQSIRSRAEELSTYEAEPDTELRAVLVFGRRVDDSWLDGRLKSLPIYQRGRFVDGLAFRVSVPILRDVDTCGAYALLVLFEDRWGARDRIRICRYVKRPGVDVGHWFLDYRIDAEGRFAAGTAREFCTEAHANAFRQREWRKRQVALRLRSKQKARKPK